VLPLSVLSINFSTARASAAPTGQKLFSGMPQSLRIFVSSPADVPEERLRADLIVDKLSQEYGRFFTIESYRWEHEAMLASKHFQDAIEPPSAFEIVVLILWSRLGTPLPEKTATREYRGIDGRSPVTGTEWEYEEALKVARERGAPDLLAFRNISPAPIDPCDSRAQDETNAQLKALNAFWTRNFAYRGVFLAAHAEYRTLEEFAQRLEQTLRKLIERRIKAHAVGASGDEPIWLAAPFRGLESYEFEQAAVFFGRDAAITKATEQLAANARSGCAFLLVSGASGSGKSSLVKAGLVPRLMKPQRISGIGFQRRVIFRPAPQGGDVFLGLATALARAATEGTGLPELIAPGQVAAQLARHLRGTEPGYLFANAIGRLTEAERKSGRLLPFEEAKLILVVDQFEELFTVSGISPEDRWLFVQLLAGLARSGAVWVIATLRADFWHRAAEIPELVALAGAHGRIDLAPATAAELAEIIRKPAQAAGLSFEAHLQTGLGLDAVLAQDAAAELGALPLLSFTLDELYKSAKARGEAVLTHASYEALGGLEGAIANRADEIVGRLPAASQAALSRVLRTLTTVSGATESVPVERSVPIDIFVEGSPARVLVDAFFAARLLVADGESGAAATVRLAHAALISRWQRARDQLTADRRDLETRTIVERQFDRWSRARGRTRQLLLLRNPDLANAVDLAKRWGDELEAPTQEFIRRSFWRAQLSQSLSAVAAVLFGLFAVAAVVEAWQSQTSARLATELKKLAQANENKATVERNQALLVQSRFLADRGRQAQSNHDSTTVGGLLALEALPTETFDRPFLGSAEVVLGNALRGLEETIVIGGENSPMYDASFSPDGHTVLTVTDNAARISDAVSGKESIVIKSETLNGASFSPSGRQIVTGSTKGIVSIWNAASGQLIRTLTGQSDTEIRPKFSPDEQRVATISFGNSARIWNLSDGTVTVLKGHTAGLQKISFSPDGLRVVTASDDNSAIIWDAGTGNLIVRLTGHTEQVLDAEFSPDGRLVVTASGDNTARIWNSETGALIKVLEWHKFWVTTATFNEDSHRILTGSADNNAVVWDVQTGKPLFLAARHLSPINSAAFSPDGQEVVTASYDHTARIWDLDAPLSTRSLSGHTKQISSADFSPDGRHLLTASYDGSARVWDVETRQAIQVLNVPGKEIRGAAMTADGSRILTAFDRTARLWDASTGQVLRDFEGPAFIYGVAFSPDGRRFVTASGDKVARVWNSDTGSLLATLTGHLDAVLKARFSHDGRYIVTAGASDSSARVWNSETGELLLTLTGSGSFFDAVFSLDDRRIATASDDETARVWEFPTGRQISVLRGHDDFVHSVAFSSDGNRLLTGSTDKTAVVWDIWSGQPVAVLGNKNYVELALFSPDNRRVVTALANGALLIWTVFPTTSDAINTARKIIPRCLTRLERNEAFLDPAPQLWCVEMEKWPYNTKPWKDWLEQKAKGLNPDLPPAPEWRGPPIAIKGHL
jgi:WD40 repeat protein